MFKVFILNSVCLLLISSCGDSGNHSSEVRVPELKSQTCAPEARLLASGIVGGIRVTETDRDSKNVMMLYSDGELCTAAAISSHVLVTAAHCITGTAQKSWVGLYSSLSCESGFDSRYDTVKIKEFVVHPHYTKNPEVEEYSTNDIALVFLDEALPITYPIYRIANPDDLSTTNSLFFWGYGDVNYKSGGAGMLRKTQLARSDFEILKERNKIRINQTAGHGICQGDSGGPGLVKINNELQILGINSYVEGLGSRETLCANKAYLTLADSFVPWISSSMRERNEYLKQ